VISKSSASSLPGTLANVFPLRYSLGHVSKRSFIRHGRKQRLFLLPGLLILAHLAFGFQNKALGPESYHARTDQRIEPYRPAAPSLGPAGSLITDPSFGSRIVRVTDAQADPIRKGRWFATPASAEQNPWNSNSTHFYVNTAGGQYVLYDFEPSSMRIRQRDVMRVGWQGEPQFSYTRPDIVYGIRARNAAFQEYQISSGKVSIIHTISDCTKSEMLGHSITVSADDQRMSTSVGPRPDENNVVYVYDLKQGCRWYNTETGEIGGQWGPKGQIGIPDRFRIHNHRMSKSGKFVWIQREKNFVGKHWVVWEVETMKVAACASQCSGHRAVGYSQMIAPTGFVHPMDLIERPLDHLENVRHLIPGLQPLNGAQFWYDMHLSWNNVDPEDSKPICLSTYLTGNPATPGAPPMVSHVWDNEIICVATNGKDSTVWRFAHTYSTAKNGFWSTPRGNVSPDGRFFMFTSDWQDQLGPTPSGKAYRTDVFIVELK
jgi:hypothetical protein